MRTVSYRLGDISRAVINIGKVAENEYTRVKFDAGDIFAEYPSAAPSLSVINPAGTAYPAVVVREGDTVIWDVADSDLTACGQGEFQLTFTESGVVVKSCVGRTRIERSIVASGSTPDPVQNWLDEAAEVLEAVEDAIPAGGTQGQVMGKLSDDDYDIGWIDQTGGGGGGGTSNYNELSNKPKINGTTLSGNKSLADLGAASAEAVNAKYTKPASGIPASDLASGVIPDVSGLYTKPAGGIPKTDMASGVQDSLGKADTAYQKPSGGVPSSDMASAVQTSLGKADTAYQKPGSGIPASDIADGVIPDVSGFYTKPQTGIPASDLASGVIPDVSGFYTKPVTGIPASDLASGVIPTVHNVPAGGSANQVLAKNSGTDYDLKWVNQSGGGGGAEIDDTAGEGDTTVVWSADKTWTETEALKEAIENLLVSGGESVTLTNAENMSAFNSGESHDGFNKDGFQDGVITFSIRSGNTEKNPYTLYNCAKGSGVWLVGFKYKLVKLNSSSGDPTSIRIHTGASEYQDDTVVYDTWVNFSKVFTGDLTRIRVATRGYSTAPAQGDVMFYMKEMYVYDVADVDSDMRTYIINQQNTNYQDGTVTYSTGSGTPAPDTTLTESGKVPDSKVVGDAIKASGNIINVKYFGVKGNGTDDDTTAIRNLFTSKTGTFYFPAGTYKITGTITLPANSEIVGDGDVSIINMYSCTDLTACTFRDNDKVYPYILITGDNCAVRHIKLTGNNSLQEKRHAGIGVLDADRCCIEDVTISNINYDSSQTGDATVSGYGICVNRSTFVDVVKCDVRTCGYECIGIVDDCNYCTVRDCYTQDGWRTCIQVHRGSCNTLIENNYMKQTHNKYDACFTVHGMTDQKIRNLRVVNNTMECTQNGDQGQNYCAPAQIMSHSDCLVFMGNRIKGGKRAFYIAEDSNNAKIIGNDMNCNDTSDYGVTLASTATIVIGNYLDNEATTKTNNISQNPTLVGNVGIGS